jgi:shikimate dehydrogenase
MRTHDVVIHGTPIGMHPHDGDSAIPKEYLRDCQVVFDMVYRPYNTRLLRDAEAAGCKTIPGIEMLINQAVLQFERWTGLPAPYPAMRAAALTALGLTP